MTAESAQPQWSVRWVATRSGFQLREVFTSPDGVEYVRTPSPDLADFVYQSKIPGLPPLLLKRRDKVAAHLRKEHS